MSMSLAESRQKYIMLTFKPFTIRPKIIYKLLPAGYLALSWVVNFRFVSLRWWDKEYISQLKFFSCTDALCKRIQTLKWIKIKCHILCLSADPFIVPLQNLIDVCKSDVLHSHVLDVSNTYPARICLSSQPICWSRKWECMQDPLLPLKR